MEDLSASQLRLRSRFETGIALAGPWLDAVLAIGERISRLAEPRDYEYYPVREVEDSASDAGAAANAFDDSGATDGKVPAP